MKITGQTTLDELKIERMRLGITRLLITLTPEGDMQLDEIVMVSIASNDGMLTVQAGEIYTALDEAFRKREQQIASLVEGRL